jgi:hypothetical protein
MFHHFILPALVPQAHIGAFGGNKNRVTLFGESAGATAACNALVMEDAKTLFQTAILQSAFGGCYATTIEDARSDASQFAVSAGCVGASFIFLHRPSFLPSFTASFLPSIFLLIPSSSFPPILLSSCIFFRRPFLLSFLYFLPACPSFLVPSSVFVCLRLLPFALPSSSSFLLLPFLSFLHLPSVLQVPVLKSATAFVVCPWRG